jgi:hypothetical protein
LTNSINAHLYTIRNQLDQFKTRYITIQNLDDIDLYLDAHDILKTLQASLDTLDAQVNEFTPFTNSEHNPQYLGGTARLVSIPQLKQTRQIFKGLNVEFWQVYVLCRYPNMNKVLLERTRQILFRKQDILQ